MRVAIAGGSGFVGKAITEELIKQKHKIVILTRNKSNKKPSTTISYVQWLNDSDKPEKELENIEVFINLAGESLNSGRWTETRKKQIMDSRLLAVKELHRIIASLQTKPKVFLNASAIGYYGTSLTQTFTEEDIKHPTDFLSNTVDQWEKEAFSIVESDIRTVFMRFGVILGKKEGALPRILLPYTFFVGGTIGSGKQWLSWIHIKDVAKAVVFCINHDSIYGPVNFTAPEPQTMKAFGKTIADVIHKPHWMPTPSLFLKLALGEMSILVLEGQKVLPKKLLHQGYTFSFPTLKSAIKNILL